MEKTNQFAVDYLNMTWREPSLEGRFLLSKEDFFHHFLAAAELPTKHPRMRRRRAAVEVMRRTRCVLAVAEAEVEATARRA